MLSECKLKISPVYLRNSNDQTFPTRCDVILHNDIFHNNQALLNFVFNDEKMQ